MRIKSFLHFAVLTVVLSILFYACDTESSTPLTSYSITYNLDGGTNDVINPSTYTSALLPFVFQPATKTGNAFSGWFTDALFSSVIGQIATGSTADLILYAKWVEKDPQNLAQGSPVYVSGTEETYMYDRYFAVDGDILTRWSSQEMPPNGDATGPGWITIDLGVACDITDIIISWEACPSADYTIEGSDNNSTWTTIKTQIPGGIFVTDTITGLSVNYRYIRIYTTDTQGTFGISVFEIVIKNIV